MLMPELPMSGRPSDKCGNCVWWHEGSMLCQGCPNNPETVPRAEEDND